jgi:NADPH2:quinone reductase
MKAIVVREFGGPEVMKLEAVPDPIAAADQVVVQLHAIGVNTLEAYIRGGNYAVKPPLPYIPGSDGAGVIASVGAGVTAYTIGDRVYVAAHGAGTYAERVAVAASGVHPLPANATFEQGAALGLPYGTAYRALFQRGRVQPGETVLVHGATGGIGLAAVELAHGHGLTVIGTGGTDRAIALAREHGADVVVDHRAPNYTDEIATATSGRGVDLIVEMLTDLDPDRDLRLLTARGRIVFFGNRGRMNPAPRDARPRDAAFLPMSPFNASDADLEDTHHALVAALERGLLRPIVGPELPLADVARAHETVMAPGGYTVGKIILRP